MKLIPSLAALTLLPSLAMAEMTAETVVYTCDNGTEALVSYINSAEESLAVLTQNATQIALMQQVAASGAKYGPAAGEVGTVWWTADDGAMLITQGKTEAEDVTVATCAVKG